MPLSAILLIDCVDQKGIVAAVTNFILQNNGNILDLEQHVDREENAFFMRVEWDLSDFHMPIGDIGSQFNKSIGQKYKMNWRLHFSNERLRVAVFVSRLSHCLFDILGRFQFEYNNAEIPLIISNHEELKNIADQYNIPFHVFPISKKTKSDQELREIDLLKKNKIDLIVLARYMQILSPRFVDEYPSRIINIHHSFLPAFPGAKPYHSAYTRGVKIIGATSHYVTADLDSGPIIDQDIVRVSHRDEVNDLVRIGQDLEKVVLSRAVRKHIDRKTLVFKNKTIVFS